MSFRIKESGSRSFLSKLWCPWEYLCIAYVSIQSLYNVMRACRFFILTHTYMLLKRDLSFSCDPHNHLILHTNRIITHSEIIPPALQSWLFIANVFINYSQLTISYQFTMSMNRSNEMVSTPIRYWADSF